MPTSEVKTASWKVIANHGTNYVCKDLDSEGGVIVAEVSNSNEARLIAAAPELLYALQDAVADELGDNWKLRARAAIAKARGEL